MTSHNAQHTKPNASQTVHETLTHVRQYAIHGMHPATLVKPYDAAWLTCQKTTSCAHALALSSPDNSTYQGFSLKDPKAL
jgi:hypothetical protein